MLPKPPLLPLDLYLDGALPSRVAELRGTPGVAGFTSNPSLARRAGVTDYRSFCESLVASASEKPVSLEVIADDHDGMAEQARKLGGMGDNVFVKIPAMFSDGRPTDRLVRELASEGVKLNVTAVFSMRQVELFAESLGEAEAFISIFAGRLADMGVNPSKRVADAAQVLAAFQSIRLIWASPRQVFDAQLAADSGADVITITEEIWQKFSLWSIEEDEFSLRTVKMFLSDAIEAGFSVGGMDG